MSFIVAFIAVYLACLPEGEYEAARCGNELIDCVYTENREVAFCRDRVIEAFEKRRGKGN